MAMTTYETRPSGDCVPGPGRLFLAEVAAALFGISRATAHRRFTEWTNAGLWERLHQAFLHRLGVIGEIDWSRAVVDSIAVRAEKGDPKPDPTRSTAASPDRRFTSCATGVACR